MIIKRIAIIFLLTFKHYINCVKTECDWKDEIIYNYS